MTRGARRLVVLPLVVLLEALILVASPLLAVAGGLLSLLTRSSRPVRTVGLVVAFAAMELDVLGRIHRGVDDWDALVRDVLTEACERLRRLLDVTVKVEEGSVRPTDLERSEGLLVLAR